MSKPLAARPPTYPTIPHIENPSVSVTRRVTRHARPKADANVSPALAPPRQTAPQQLPARSVPCPTAECEPTGLATTAEAHPEYRPTHRETPSAKQGRRYPNLHSAGPACP